MIVRKSRSKAKIRSGLIGLLAIWWGLGLGIMIYYSISQFANFEIIWYGIKMPLSVMAFFIAAFFLFWSVTGLVNMVKSELQIQGTPTKFIVFLLTNAFMFTGFVSMLTLVPFYADSGVPSRYFTFIFLYILFMSSVSSCILFMLFDVKDFITFKRLSLFFRDRKFGSFYRESPMFLIGLASAAIAFLGFAIYFGLMGGLVEEISGTKIIPQELALFYLLSILLFLCRDVCIFLFANFNTQSKRPDGLAITILLILYILLPAVFAKSPDVLFIFVPTPLRSDWVSIIPPLAEFGILFFLVRRKIVEDRG